MHTERTFSSEIANRVYQEGARIRSVWVEPWLSFPYAKPFEVMDFHGKPVRYQNLAFTGAPREVFWGHVEPFIRDMVLRMVDHAATVATQRRVTPDPVVRAARAALRLTVETIHMRMAQMDSLLRPQGKPNFEYQRRTQALHAFIDSVTEEWATAAPDAGEARPAVESSRAARSTPVAQVEPEPTPSWRDHRTGGVPLRGWLQICKALGLTNLRAKHKQLKRLNAATGGPITWVGRSPEVDRGELIAWIEATKDRAMALDERRNRSRTLAALDERDGAHATDHGLTHRAKPHGRTKQRPA